MKLKFNVPNKVFAITVSIICIILIVLSTKFNIKFSLINKTLGLISSPVQQGLKNVQNWFGDRMNSLTNLKDMEEENAKLQKEVNQLRYENKILQQYKLEVNNLRALLKLDKKYADYPKIGAQVIGKSPGNWYNVFIINKGSNDGLKNNMVVLAGEGLVGHIIEVGLNYSKVLAIIDDRSNVSAKVLRTSDTLFVSGDQRLTEQGLCKIDLIDENADIVVGDEIVTSHLGDIYPPGIMIGKVKEIKKEAHQLTKYAYLKPVVDFKHLEEVLVINKLWKEDIQLGGK